MQNYKEAGVVGTKRARARYIGLANEYVTESIVEGED